MARAQLLEIAVAADEREPRVLALRPGPPDLAGPTSAASTRRDLPLTWNGSSGVSSKLALVWRRKSPVA